VLTLILGSADIDKFINVSSADSALFKIVILVNFNVFFYEINFDYMAVHNL
jgi:hypothetical protein